MGAVPVPTARTSPTGSRLTDGYKSTITLALNPAINFFEMTVQPPGLDGGDPVDTTTMHNTTWRTKSPRGLIESTECTFTAAYATIIFDETVFAFPNFTVIQMINRPTTITVTFPDNSTLAFYGYLKNFEPDPLEEGTMPQATVTIVPTNMDPSDCTNQAPQWAPGVGSCW